MHRWRLLVAIPFISAAVANRAAFISMPMKFLCPNGHTLSTTPDRAGQPAQCPKCGVKFLVPDGDDEGEAGSDNGSQAAPKGNDETIAFLCPNGHRLTGPISLQGKAGQCPHCKEKFRIPVYDEPPDDEPGEEIIEVDDIEEIEEIEEVEEIDELPAAAASSGGSSVIGSSIHSGDAPDLGFLSGIDTSVGSQLGTAAAPAYEGELTVAGGHAAADIFCLLWDARGDRTVELHLSGGDIIAPEHFSAGMSGDQFGVFAVAGVGATFSVVAVPWDDVRRITLSKLQELPPGMFE